MYKIYNADSHLCFSRISLLRLLPFTARQISHTTFTFECYMYFIRNRNKITTKVKTMEKK